MEYDRWNDKQPAVQGRYPAGRVSWEIRAILHVVLHMHRYLCKVLFKIILFQNVESILVFLLTYLPVRPALRLLKNSLQNLHGTSQTGAAK
jgi:hypothetical protein